MPVADMDFDDLGAKASEPTGRVLILRNPHNPVGRVWSRPELERFLAERAGLALAQGYWFGREGAGFARMTVSCRRARPCVVRWSG